MAAKPGVAAEFYSSDERCYILEMHNCAEDEDCSIARARVSPGVTTELHSLDGICERYVVLNGEGLLEVCGSAPARVSPMDVVAIPAGASQRVTNVGQEDLTFLCICTPRFRKEAYVTLQSPPS